MDVPLVRGRMHVNRDAAMTGGDGRIRAMADYLFDRFARGN
jgi:hypothetical protein